MDAVHTSVTDPLRVDWLPLSLPGRIGLTFAPGKHGVRTSGGRWARDLEADLERLRGEHRAEVLVSLIEDSELRPYRIEGLFDAAAACGLEVRRFPIADGRVPRGGPPELAPLVEGIVAAARAGRNTVIHCIGGLGRTGTVAGCILVAMGAAPAEALWTLAAVRGPRCPETAAQHWFVEAYAVEVGAAPPAS